MRQSIALKIMIILLLATAATLGWWRNLSAPIYEGSLSGFPLAENVEVKFDSYGVPHIEAKSEQDAFFSLGYVMASERLFQMDLSRRLAKGKLSELFGEKTIEVDKLFRTLGLHHHFKNKVADALKGSAISRHISSMKSFYAGVNHFIKEGEAPREYLLLGQSPEVFSVDDGYAIIGYMAYTFAIGLKTDLLYDEILAKEGEDTLNKIRIRPYFPKQRTVSTGASNIKVGPCAFEKAQDWIEENLSFFTGSNGWVLGPTRSKSGNAILANDPHVRLNSPGLWFEGHMKWRSDRGSKEVYGHFVPGLPFAALGHNRHISWGVTISYVDDMDFYRERRDGDRVFYKGEWVELSKRTEEIVVKGGATVRHLVEVGPHGPLLDGLTRIGTDPKSSIALKWSHFHSKNRPAEAFYKLMNAENKRDFKLALSLGKSPGLNILYADKLGNIGRYLFGAFPIRPEYMVGDIVYPGDNPRYEVDEELDFFDRAHIENPPSGVIVSANQRIEAPANHIRGYYQPSDRYTSIHEVLAGKPRWSIEGLKYVQAANINIFNNVFREKLIGYLKKAKLEAQYLPALEVLEKWDGVSTRDSAGSLIFHQLFFELERNLLDTKLQKYYERICDLTSFWHHTKKKILSERIGPEVVASFKQAVTILKKRYGDSATWRWGNAHKIEFVHPLGKASKILASIFNFGSFELDGGYNHINNLRRSGCKRQFNVQIGPSSRRLIDMGQPESSLGIMPMGNSSHLYGPFYANQFDLFVKGKYRPQLLQLAQEDTYGTLILRSAKEE